MHTFANQFRDETARLLARFGWRALPMHILLLIAFGIFLPWMRGLDFLDPVLLAAYACLGVMFAAPAAAQAFAKSANEPAPSMAEVYARLAIAVLYGEVMTVAILVTAFATFYLLHPLPMYPDLPGMAELNAFGLACSLAAASISGWVALRFSPQAARASIRLIFLALLIVFFFKSRWLPDVAGTGTLVALAVAATAILAIRRSLLRNAETD